MPTKAELKKEYIKNMSYIRTFLRKVKSGVKYQNREYNYVQLKINKVRRVLPHITHLTEKLHMNALNTVDAVEKILKQRVSTPPSVMVKRATLTKKPSPDKKNKSIIAFVNNFVKHAHDVKNEESYKRYIQLGNNVRTEVRRLKIPQSNKNNLISMINMAVRESGPPPNFTPEQRAAYWGTGPSLPFYLRNNFGNAPVRRENNPMYVASPSSPPKSPSPPKRRSPPKRPSPPKSRSPPNKGCIGALCNKIRRKFKRG